jgi:predicted amidohydrolase
MGECLCYDAAPQRRDKDPMGGGRMAGGADGRLRLALAQTEPVLGDVAANLKAHVRLAREARRRGADLIVFPELSLTGYILQDMVPEVAVRLDRPGPLRPLLEASRSIAIAAGLVEETTGHRFHNTALFLDRGRALHAHRKVYLPTYGMFDEGRDFAPGDRLAAFDTRLGRMGLLVCEDLWHLSSALVLAQDGADYLLALCNSPTEGIDPDRGLVNHATWRDLVKVTAQLQTLFVAYVNRVGFEDGVHFGGGSCVVDPAGRVIAEARVIAEDLVVCDLERAALRRARTLLPLLRDERLPVVGREVQRLLAVPATGRRAGRKS